MTEPQEEPASEDVYAWFVRGRELHAAGRAGEAVPLLQAAVERQPAARSLREALARALFDDHRFAEAASVFRSIVNEDPADDYAQFGLGLASTRRGDLDAAVTHLAVAVALRPDAEHYARALRLARAARGRSSPSGPVPPPAAGAP